MISLRPFRESDAEKILSWCTGEAAYYLWTAGTLGDYPVDASRFGRLKNMLLFTATDDDEIMGFFTLRQPGEDPEILRFGMVTVDPARRGQGCGREMVSLGLKYAAEVCGARKVTLGVFDTNRAAINCYKSAGFRDSGERIEYEFMGEPWTDMEFEAVLK